MIVSLSPEQKVYASPITNPKTELSYESPIVKLDYDFDEPYDSEEDI